MFEDLKGHAQVFEGIDTTKLLHVQRAPLRLLAVTDPRHSFVHSRKRIRRF